MIDQCVGARTSQEFDNDPDHDTLALLHAEIARLEAELAAHNSAMDVPLEPGSPGPTHQQAENEALKEQISELTAELATRDEAMDLLLEQARLYEESALAQKSEWEQLYQWVEEVERRIGAKDTRDAELEAELQNERSQSEALRLAVDADRRGFEAQRKSFERELEIASSRLAQTPDARPIDSEIEQENIRLRATCAKLERAASAAAEVESLQTQLATMRRALQTQTAESRRIEDERQREHNEYEAVLATLRSQIARLSVERTEEAPRPVSSTQPAALDADERIRAFRQHLRELHQEEEDERATRGGLANRLSRLWRRTSPG